MISSTNVGIAGYILSLPPLMLAMVAHYLHLPYGLMRILWIGIFVTAIMSLALCGIGFKHHKVILTMGILNDAALLMLYFLSA